MIKAKQKTLRIFDIEISSEEDFFAYMEKNLVLLKEFLLLLHGEITPKISQYLDANNICFMKAEECSIKFNVKPSPAATMPKAEPSVEIDQKKITIPSQEDDTITPEKTLLIDKTIRSGEEITSDGDVTIFGRVNSAAKVIVGGNASIFGTIDGLVQCDGEYMIVKDLDKGHVIFNGDIIEKSLFDGKLKKLTVVNGEVVIKDIM